jgi:hypothetical protein
MPVSFKKTDNRCLGLKLLLRRDFLDRYHPAGATVFDACQGNGELWRRLRTGLNHLKYWGVDVKPARGRVKVDSERVLQIPGWSFDVIDVDTYGMPWGHWKAILANGKGPVTVFLTVGNLTLGSKVCKEVMETLGVQCFNLQNAIAAKLNGDFTLEMIGHAEAAGWRIVEAKEAVPFNPGTARYFGVRIEPKTTASKPSARPAAKRARKPSAGEAESIPDTLGPPEPELKSVAIS